LVNVLPDSFDIAKNAFANGKQALIDAIDDLNTAYETLLLTEDGAYRLAMDAFISAKKALLEGRLDGFATSIKSELESALAIAEGALVTAKSTADGLIQTANLTLESAISMADGTLTVVLSVIDMTIVDASIESTKDGFKATFTAEFSVQISDVYWNDLKPAE